MGFTKLWEGKKRYPLLANLLLLSLSYLQAADLDRNTTVPTPACSPEPVQKMIRTGTIPQAYSLSKTLYRKCHTRELARLYAKLAFWNKDFSTAFHMIQLFDPKEKLYHQIYAAKVIEDLKKDRQVEIPPILVDDYDVLAARIQYNIRHQRFERAYRLSRRLYEKYHSKEALELQANLLFWMRRYSQSLKLFHQLRDQEKITQVKQAILAQKMAHLDQAIRHDWIDSKKSQARERFEKLNEDEKSYYRTHYRDNACRVQSTRMIGIGFDQVHYSDDRYRDQTNYLEFTLPIDRYTVYGKIENTDRYGLQDTKASLEIYPPGSHGYWGYLSLSATPDADFYSLYSIGMYLFKGIENEEIGIGYHYSQYHTGPSHLVNIEYKHYFSDYLTFRTFAYYELISTSYAAGTELAYETPCHLMIKAAYLYSTAKEHISDSRFFQERGHNLKFDLEYPITSSTSFGSSLYGYRTFQTPKYTSYGMSFYLRKYW